MTMKMPGRLPEIAEHYDEIVDHYDETVDYYDEIVGHFDEIIDHLDDIFDRLDEIIWPCWWNCWPYRCNFLLIESIFFTFSIKFIEKIYEPSRKILR